MGKTTYMWDELSDNVAAEYDDEVLSAAYTQEPDLYGNLLSQNRNGVTSYYHCDGQGDTVALTDDSGNVTDTIEYDAFGNVIASAGNTVTPYQAGGQRGFQRMPAFNYCYARSMYYASSTGRWFSSQTNLSIGMVGFQPYAATFANSLVGDASEKESPVTIAVTYDNNSIGPKCGEYSYNVHVNININITTTWYDAQLKAFGITSSPELLIFQHFHEVFQNQGCESPGCGIDKCIRGTLNVKNDYDYYEYVDWNSEQKSGAKYYFWTRSKPKSDPPVIIDYATGFVDKHREPGFDPAILCIDNQCGSRKTYQHVRIFWKKHTKNKKDKTPIDFDVEHWGGGNIEFERRTVRGNLRKERPSWWDSVRPAFNVMLLHTNNYCCCPDSFNQGTMEHQWSGSKPKWWY